MRQDELDAVAARVERVLDNEAWAHESLPPVDAAVILIARERARLVACGQHEAAAHLVDACRALAASAACVHGQGRPAGVSKRRQEDLVVALAEYEQVDLATLRDCMMRAGYTTPSSGCARNSATLYGFGPWKCMMAPPSSPQQGFQFSREGSSSHGAPPNSRGRP